MNDEQFKAYVEYLRRAFDEKDIIAWMAEFIYDHGLPMEFAEFCTGEMKEDWQDAE